MHDCAPDSQTSPAVPRFSTLFRSRSEPPALLDRLRVHNAVVHRVRAYLAERGYVEIPVPELTAATGSCEMVDSMFSLDYFGGLAFPRQTGQLYLERMVAGGLDAVYCEGESLRKEWKIDTRHLTEFKLIEIERRDLSLEQLMDLQEDLLKDAALHLHADLIGGANATRMDLMAVAEHPRMTYRQALKILQRKGFALGFGDDLDRKAEAALTRHCGGLPIHVTHFPESLKFFNMKIDRTDERLVECVDYILPFSGESFGGSLREPDPIILTRRLREGVMFDHLMTRAAEFAAARAAADPALDEAALRRRYEEGIDESFAEYLGLFVEDRVERAGFGLGVARLLQYVMGLESIKDAVVFPLDRSCFGGDLPRELAAAG